MGMGTNATRYQILEVLARRPLSKDDLMRLAKKIGFVLSNVDAAECLLASQGGTMNSANFNIDLLIAWLVKNVPRMRAYIADKKRDEAGIPGRTLLLNSPSYISEFQN